MNYKVYDHDVAVIDADSLAVERYLPAAGTNLFAVAVHPQTGDVFVANTDSRNLTQFEANLRGHVVDHRLTRYRARVFEKAVFDLNPDVDPTVLPNPAAWSSSLAQPHALTFEGGDCWVAAADSDRLALVDSESGLVLRRIDLRPGSADSRTMRGPRGLAMHPSEPILYVLNKISNTVSVVSTASASVTVEFPTGTSDPMPRAIREGRGFLFDARRSGNGLVSCSSCHLDADRDGIAWDLGDPAGAMTVEAGYNAAVHESVLLPRPMHPMKGPMLTQTLRNLKDGAPFHWRGDKPSLRDFNALFSTLLGGDPVSDADFETFETYLLSLRHHPNPNRNLDDSFRTELVGGSPARGRRAFNIHDNHCQVCHSGPRGSNNNIDDLRLTDSRDSVKTPPLQTIYQRAGFDGNPGGVNISGYGLNRDGSRGMLPTVHFYELSQLREQDLKDVTAFLLSFDTGTPPIMGQARTFDAANRNDATLTAAIALLEDQARKGTVDLVAEGRRSGQLVRMLYRPSEGVYRSADNLVSLTAASVLASLSDADAVTFTAVLPGQGAMRISPTTP